MSNARHPFRCRGAGQGSGRLPLLPTKFCSFRESINVQRSSGRQPIYHELRLTRDEYFATAIVNFGGKSMVSRPPTWLLS